MKQFRIWSRLLLVVVVFVFVLKYTETAEAGSPQIYCTSGYGQCMSGSEQTMGQCTECCNEAGSVDWCFTEVIAWTDGTEITTSDCFDGAPNSCGQGCAEEMNAGAIWCAENYCYPYPG